MPEGHAAGFVAHVRAVREVVAAKGADKQLIQVGRFVAGAAGGVELGLIGVLQRIQVLGDQGKGGVPTDRLVMIAGGVIAHRLGQAALVFQPVIALLTQLADAVTGEKGGVHTALGRFPVDRFGAVLAELDVAVFRRITPGAAGAVEAAVLVGLEQGTQVLEGLLTVQPEVRHAAQRAPTGGCAGVGFIAWLDRLQAHGWATPDAAGL